MSFYRLVEFCLANTGATLLIVFLAKDFSNRDFFPYGLKNVLGKKPFTCPLCMGFYMGMTMWWFFEPNAVWHSYIIHGLIGACASWLAYSSITGDY